MADGNSLNAHEQGSNMDHKEQHHQHHRKERAHKKEEQKHYANRQEKDLLPMHPVWLFGAGAALVIVAVLIWTLFLR
jgi:hypothetical protein